METKLIAAEIATAAGVTTIITSSKNPENIFRIIEYNNSLKSAPGTPHEPSLESPDLRSADLSSSSGNSSFDLTRPPHTLFKPSILPMRDLKSWTRHTLFPSGSVIIDCGAHHVLSRRESGGRLLAAGVIGVLGAFASGQAVRIVIRHRSEDAISADMHTALVSYANGLETTRPGTPNLAAIASLSSSVASLEPLPRSIYPAEAEDPKQTMPEENSLLVGEEGDSDMDIVEIGRGLANYNSAQIDRVKGLNR